MRCLAGNRRLEYDGVSIGDEKGNSRGNDTHLPLRHEKSLFSLEAGLGQIDLGLRYVLGLRLHGVEIHRTFCMLRLKVSLESYLVSL